MKQRLQTLLAAEKLASSRFADILGVNRSSISHLLSGRNNPSLDFLQKILIKFPHINPDWLLMGQGSMYRNKDDGRLKNIPNQLSFNVKQEKPLLNHDTNKDIEPIKEDKTICQDDNPTFNLDAKKDYQSFENMISETKVDKIKNVDKIVFFYSDNTFDTYYPNK